jgi:hypothetical protein
MPQRLRFFLLRFFHWLGLSLVAQLVSVDSGQPQRAKDTILKTAGGVAFEVLSEGLKWKIK